MSLDLGRLRKRLQQALGDQFTVGDLLGEGGFAAVFRVRDKAAKRDVAVKVLDLGLTPSPALAERFVLEARTVAGLEHPHIVPIHKVGGYRNEVLYIVMRVVEGPSLGRLLAERSRLPLGDATRIARQAADALDYAHRRGVVHRDIKPDNILLDPAGQVQVTDFGIAKAAEAASGSQLTTEGMVVGTPQYMSPEQATGEKIDPRSDIYSLGIVLYQMLAGAVPFDGESAQAILMKQATGTPEPIRNLRRDVPPALAAVLDRMLAKDPGERFATAAELSEALAAAVPPARGDRVVRSGAAAVRRLAAVVLAAAVAVAAWIALSPPARIRLVAPVPDTLNTSLRRRGILAQDDAAVFAFAPTRESSLLLVTERRVVVVAPRRLRGYPRDSVAYSVRIGWSRGPGFVFLLLAGERRDTVFPSLSPRALWDLTRGLSGVR
jgi:serine/threonine-protein kinase